MTPRQSIHPSVLAVTMLIMKAMVTVICSPTSPSLFHVLSMLTEPKGRRPIMIVTNALYAEIDRLRARVKELEDERDKLRDDLSRDKAILQSLLDREHEERKDLEEEFTGKLKALERENEALTKENMELREDLGVIENMLGDMREIGVAE